MMKLAIWRLFLASTAFGICLCPAFAQDVSRRQVQLTDASWSSLTQEQRDLVGSHFIVEVEAATNYARIVYVQGLDESTPGTTVGAATGSALAQARYIDKTNLNHYSATKQVGAGLVGAVLGSMLDAPARQQYRHVYTLKDSMGNVTTVEKMTDTAIFVPPGICVNSTTFVAVNDALCDNVLPNEVVALLSETPISDRPPEPEARVSAVQKSTPVAESVASSSSEGLVTCRLGNTANMQTTASRCQQAGGQIKQ